MNMIAGGSTAIEKGIWQRSYS